MRYINNLSPRTATELADAYDNLAATWSTIAALAMDRGDMHDSHYAIGQTFLAERTASHFRRNAPMS